MSEWISVKDKLPDKTDYYLVCLESPRCGLKDGVTTSYYQHKAKNWKAVYNPSVTHWMPIPEPPKAE